MKTYIDGVEIKSERLERLERELNSMKGTERYRLTKTQIVNEQLYGSFNGKGEI